MRRRLAVMLCVAGPALIAAPPAAAAIMRATFSGIVNGGVDSTGEVFAPGTFLDGRNIPMSVSFVYDTAAAGERLLDVGIRDNLYSGGYNGTNHLLEVSATVGGVTFVVPMLNSPYVYDFDGAAPGSVLHSKTAYTSFNDPHTGYSVYMRGVGSQLPASLEQIVAPTTLFSTDFVSTTAIFQMEVTNGSGGFVHRFYASITGSGTYEVSSAENFGQPEPAPEPAPLALFLLSAAGLAAARRWKMA